VSLEDERREGFGDATMRQSHQIRMPVFLEVGVSHIRITSVSEIRKYRCFINVSVDQSPTPVSFVGMQIHGNYLIKRHQRYIQCLHWA